MLCISHFSQCAKVDSLVPRLPQFFNVTCRKTREPNKIYHVRDVGQKQVGVQQALTMTQQFLMSRGISRISVVTAIVLLAKSLNVELTQDIFGQMSVLGTTSLFECPEGSTDQRYM